MKKPYRCDYTQWAEDGYISAVILGTDEYTVYAYCTVKEKEGDAPELYYHCDSFEAAYQVLQEWIDQVISDTPRSA